ncbi:hypothetical protein P691DRAFT_786491 [Macrolepiota fuliginosa MF-IS2]|uniref:Uncharacterized protein n=1 Tax=Macrolepiota fuliginosa MF-IS2 TaxID=1400762 RepID=A0A9P6C0G9_9AGAR|nr:hypothetical protein P691DRAFT_786491 [Macrolepiota fuliginosa MF-IS2]
MFLQSSSQSYQRNSYIPEVHLLADELQGIAHKLAKDMEQWIQDSKNSVDNFSQLMMFNPTTIKTHEGAAKFVSSIWENLALQNRQMCDHRSEKLLEIKKELVKPSACQIDPFVMVHQKGTTRMALWLVNTRRITS